MMVFVIGIEIGVSSISGVTVIGLKIGVSSIPGVTVINEVAVKTGVLDKRGELVCLTAGGVAEECVQPLITSKLNSRVK